MNKLAQIFIVSLMLQMLSISSYGQKGANATYRADAMYVVFSHYGTDEMFKEPLTMGRDVAINYNVSYESFSIGYTDAKTGARKSLNLKFIRYEKEDDDAMIMEDGHGNPYTVYNYLEKENSLNIVSHDLIEEKYVVMQLILNVRKVK